MNLCFDVRNKSTIATAPGLIIICKNSSDRRFGKTPVAPFLGSHFLGCRLARHIEVVSDESSQLAHTSVTPSLPGNAAP